MASDDYEDDQDFDEQDMDQDDIDNEDDEGEDAPDTSTDEGLVDGICDLLSKKFHLDMPPDTDPAKFVRDLYAALHGHPGVAALGGGAQMSSRATKLRAERLSHRRRRKETQARRLSAGQKRGRKEQVLAAVLKNCGLT